MRFGGLMIDTNSICVPREASPWAPFWARRKNRAINRRPIPWWRLPRSTQKSCRQTTWAWSECVDPYMLCVTCAGATVAEQKPTSRRRPSLETESGPATMGGGRFTNAPMKSCGASSWRLLCEQDLTYTNCAMVDASSRGKLAASIECAERSSSGRTRSRITACLCLFCTRPCPFPPPPELSLAWPLAEEEESERSWRPPECGGRPKPRLNVERPSVCDDSDPGSAPCLSTWPDLLERPSGIVAPVWSRRRPRAPGRSATCEHHVSATR